MGSTELDELEQRAVQAITEARDAEALRALEHSFLDKGGEVGGLLKRIPTLPPEERKAFGQGANRVKQAVEKALEARRSVLEEAALSAELDSSDFDPTLPPAPVRRGAVHPVTRVTRELEDIFSSMGYAILDGPEVELDYYNFQALNIPSDHPAREMYDTFWCDRESRLLLRTHTSPVQIRALETLEPPFRAIVPGRCFRNETVDASHEHTFHQMEGLVVGEGVTVGHLIGTMKTFLREVFQKDLEVRMRPGYFPFVEPGFELDVRCPFCETGCGVCKKTTWIELCPCGMVHPVVLRYGGVDPEKYTGFAFGLGLSRLVMLRFGIDDIRHLMAGDARFLEQFSC